MFSSADVFCGQPLMHELKSFVNQILKNPGCDLNQVLQGFVGRDSTFIEFSTNDVYWEQCSVKSATLG